LPMVNRLHRVTRLPVVQHLAQIVGDVRRWLGLERTKMVANELTAKAEATESIKQAGKISPAMGQTSQLRPTIRPTVSPPRRSRGIGI